MMSSHTAFKLLTSTEQGMEGTVEAVFDAIAANADIADERVKTKLFRTPPVNAIASRTGVEGADQSEESSKEALRLTEKWWNRYVLSSAAGTELKDLLPTTVSYVSGISITMERRSPLVQLMLVEEKRKNEKTLPALLNRLTKEQVDNEKHEFIEAVVAYYEDLKPVSRTEPTAAASDGNIEDYAPDNAEALGKIVVIGSKEVFSSLQSAVKHKCESSVSALIESGKCDATEASQKFSLQSTSFSARMLKELGGAEFYGMKKVINKEFAVNLPSDIGAKDADDDEMFGAGRKFGGAGANTITGRVNLSAVPSLQDLKPSWRMNKTYLPMTPLMLAFQAEQQQILQLILNVESVAETSAPLVLLSGTDPVFHEELRKLRCVTDLTLRIPNGKGSVPDVIFQLCQLKKLCLRDCGYESIPAEVGQLSELQDLDVANMPLKDLPVIPLSRLKSLQRVDCSGIKLATPPLEIVQRGPDVVAQYIRDLGLGAKPNYDVLLMFIGDGEAGKTSTLLSLKNTETNCARTIDADDRTIGIDISSFKPRGEESPMQFFAWDFGGQGIYSIMQQLFVSRRALYPLLWRVRQSLDITRFDAAIKCDVCKKRLRALHGDTQQPVYRVKGQGLCHAACVSYEPLITSWTERLQFRVPGVPIVLIATHIDCASPNEVDDQCAEVEKVVKYLIVRQQENNAGVPSLRVHNGGKSLRVNNMTGEGVKELREELCRIAESLDFYGEVIPASYVALRERLRAMQRHDSELWRTWMLWNDYQQLGEECGIKFDSALRVATRFLHDVGELRYFGVEQQNSQTASAVKVPKEDDSDEDDDAAAANVTEATNEQIGSETNELLKTTVFPNPFWIVDVLRGLIRHEHSAVLEMISKDSSIDAKKRKVLRRRVYRLVQRGLLHSSLLQYIWAGHAGLFTDKSANEDEFRRLIALMKAFDILMDRGGSKIGNDHEGWHDGKEWIVPCLAAGKHRHTMESSSMDDEGLPFMCRLVYDALPPYFDMILVARIINSGIAETVDFIEGAAAFQQLGERALLFAGLGKVRNPLSVFRQDQLEEPNLRNKLRPNQSHVLVATSSRPLMVSLIKEVQNLEGFFPGLLRLCALFPCYSCRTMHRLEKQKREELTKTNSVNFHAAEAAGVQALIKAEEIDREEFKYIEEQYNKACDALDVSSYYIRHQEKLSFAWKQVPKLQELLPVEVEDNIYLQLEEAPMYKVYNSGREYPTPRFFSEVLTLFVNLLEVIKNSSESLEEAATATSSDALRVKNERKFAIAVSQIAELPTYATVGQYCSKNMNVLAIAFQLCPKLEELCGSLHELASSDTQIQCNAPLAQLDREDCVPEYMHLLRSAVKVMSEYTEQLSVKFAMTHDEQEEYRVLKNDYLQEIKHLSLGLGENELSPEWQAIVEIYGSNSPECQHQHFHFLRDSLQSLHASTTKTLNDSDLVNKWLSFVDSEWKSGDFTLPDMNHELHASYIVGQYLQRSDLWSKKKMMCRMYMSMSNGIEDAMVFNFQWKLNLILDKEINSDMDAVIQPIIDSVLEEILQLEPDFSTDVQPGMNKMQAALVQYERKYERWLPIINILCSTEEDKIDFSQLEEAATSLKGQIDDLEGVTPRQISELWTEVFFKSDSKQRESVLEKETEALTELEAAYRLLFLLKLVHTVQQVSDKDTDVKELIQKVVSFRLLDMAAPAEPQYQLPSIMDLSVFRMTHKPMVDHLKMTAVSDPPAWCVLSSDSWPPKADTLLPFISHQSQLVLTLHETKHLVKVLSQILEEYDESWLRLRVHSEKLARWEEQYPLPDMEKIEEDDYDFKSPTALGIGLLFAFQDRGLCNEILEYGAGGEDEDSREYLFLEYFRMIVFAKAGNDISLLPELARERLADLKMRDDLLRAVSHSMEEFDAEANPDVQAVIEGYYSHLLDILKLRLALRSQSGHVLESLLGRLQQVEKARTDVINAFNSKYEELSTHHDEVSMAVYQMYHKYDRDGIDKIKNEYMNSANDWKQKKLELEGQLRGGPLTEALCNLAADTEYGISAYTDVKNAGDIAIINRLAAIVHTTEQRTERYKQLMRLRLDYGPAWYFGGGVRMAPPKYSVGSSISPEHLQRDVWEDDWEKFVDGSSGNAVSFQCPAEGGETAHKIVAQPSSLCSVFFSHTKQHKAEVERICNVLSTRGMGISHFGLSGEPMEFLSNDCCVQNRSGYGHMRSYGWDDDDDGADGSIVRIEQVKDSMCTVTPAGLRPSEYEQTPRNIPKNSLSCDTYMYEDDYDEGILRGMVEVEWSGEKRIGSVVPSKDFTVSEFVKIMLTESSDAGSSDSREPHIIDVRRNDAHRLMRIHEKAIREAKVFVCCISQDLALSSFRRKEFELAVRLNMRIIPVIMPGYVITNYQHWWPPALEALSRFSLFVDMRGMEVTENNLIDSCDYVLAPALRSVLSEWVPCVAESVDSNSAKESINAQAANAAGDQFVRCEQCEAEGNRSGTFDRWQCMKLMEEWTASELKRRAEHPSEAENFCPLVTYCSASKAADELVPAADGTMAESVVHTMLVRDVLSLKVKRTSVPCPNCVTQGILPPFCFDREACLAAIDGNASGGTVTCKRCHVATPIHMIVTCEVFLSYAWGRPVCPSQSCRSGGCWKSHRLGKGGVCPQCEKAWMASQCDFENQLLVVDVKNSVEAEAGVSCWQDIDRLVGGKDLEHEMEEGIRQADVVVIFIDDRYTRSKNCIKEYLYSAKHGKYIIPVLLRNYSQVVRSTEEEGKWALKDPSNWWPEGMPSLGQFSPILMVEEEQMEDAVFEISERVQSRFHRTQRFPTADDVVSYLRDYSSWRGVWGAFLIDDSVESSGENDENPNQSSDDRRRNAIEEQVARAFVQIDTDGNNYIDEQELAAFMDQNKHGLTNQEIAAIIQTADIDCDGLLSLDELKLAILSVWENDRKAQEGEEEDDLKK